MELADPHIMMKNMPVAELDEGVVVASAQKKSRGSRVGSSSNITVVSPMFTIVYYLRVLPHISCIIARVMACSRRSAMGWTLMNVTCPWG